MAFTQWRTLREYAESRDVLLMGDVPIGEALTVWPDKAIWVGFPGSVYSLGPEATRDFALSFLKEIGEDERVAIAMSTENLVSNENLLASMHGV